MCNLTTPFVRIPLALFMSVGLPLTDKAALSEGKQSGSRHVIRALQFVSRMACNLWLNIHLGRSYVYFITVRIRSVTMKKRQTPVVHCFVFCFSIRTKDQINSLKIDEVRLGNYDFYSC